jgi:hypothetical protein
MTHDALGPSKEDSRWRAMGARSPTGMARAPFHRRGGGGSSHMRSGESVIDS